MRSLTNPPTEFEISAVLEALTKSGTPQQAMLFRRLAFDRDRLAAEVAELQKWKDAIIDASVVSGIYTNEHETDPRKAVNDLLCYEHKIALDPALTSQKPNDVLPGA